MLLPRFGTTRRVGADGRSASTGWRSLITAIKTSYFRWQPSPALADIGRSFVIVFVLRSAEFLGESDEKPFRPTDVAEPIRVFILDYFAYELRAPLAEPFKRLVDVVHGEHDAEVA